MQAIDPRHVASSARRLKSNVYGNPRYYLPVYTFPPMTTKERRAAGLETYRGRDYGAGYVLTSYNLESDIRHAMKVLGIPDAATEAARQAAEELAQRKATLAAEYVAAIGYDPFEDDASATVESVTRMLAEHEIEAAQNEPPAVGGERAALRFIAEGLAAHMSETWGDDVGEWRETMFWPLYIAALAGKPPAA
jgi:predicted TIM-barrel fold metal-dependent hydrolase